MSDHATAEGPAQAASSETGYVASPDFDRREINAFGHDDSHAVTVIGKMLVLFFFYSLVIMTIVATLTFYRVGQPAANDAHGDHHAADTADF